MKIAFIGGGNMGTAILSAVLENKLAMPDDITVSDISEERLSFLNKTYKVQVTSDNKTAVKGKDVIVFSIKPQTLPEVLPALRGTLSPEQLVLTIMAGITIKTLIEGLEHRAVIRVMPNTPAQVNESMSVWTATPDVTDVQKANASAILRSIGREIYIEDEKYLNMVTAASGSGPAYFFLFVELLTEAAIRTGLPENMAYELILQTMIGSGKMMRDTGMEPARLREMVTSKGGTTAAALDVFEKRHLKETVTEAVTAAFTRALELGGNK